MDYINQLKTRVEEKEEKIESADNAITGFMAFLQSSKFTGTEEVIDSHGGWDGDEWCEQQSHEESKDWISTGDVLRFLSDLRNQLQ